MIQPILSAARLSYHPTIVQPSRKKSAIQSAGNGYWRDCAMLFHEVGELAALEELHVFRDSAREVKL